MAEKRSHYSYAEQKYQRYKLIKVLLVFVVLFIVYNCLCAFFFSVWVVENDTMKPGLNAGDRILFTSFQPPSLGKQDDGNSYFFKRGNIVLVDTGRNQNKKTPLRILDTIVRFFTAQRISIFSDGGYTIKRVIALPGDEVTMNNYVFRVKTKNNPYSLTEFELTDRPYHPAIPQIPALWNESIPFSGNMDTIVLGPDECFVVSDDRGNTNDSRTWGVISPSSITARAILRFWPLGKIQLL
jgi:signal peptidase I